MARLPLKRVRLPEAQRGFSMIEVLVTLLIISLALLGTAGLQAYSMRLNQSGQFRTQAVFLVADLAERMEANKPGARKTAYVLAESSTVNSLSTACTTGLCPCGIAPGDCNALANFDLSQWQNSVAASLPQASWEVCVDADRDNVCDVFPVESNPITYLIRVSWVDRRVDTTQGASDATSKVGVNAVGTGERFFYTATRVIFDPDILPPP